MARKPTKRTTVPNAGNEEIPCVCGDGCGHGYFCHTAGDTCVDDSDCETGKSCNYASATGTWSCSECWPIP